MITYKYLFRPFTFTETCSKQEHHQLQLFIHLNNFRKRFLKFGIVFYFSVLSLFDIFVSVSVIIRVTNILFFPVKPRKYTL